jgi:hypothetical protein
MPYRDGSYAEPTNDDRAEWALAAVNAHAALTHYRPDEQAVSYDDLTAPTIASEYVGDLLADLMHLCDATGNDFAELLDGARNNYDCEKVCDICSATREEQRLEYLRGEIRAERISYGELAELAELAPHINPSDVELREWAGLPEYDKGEESDD